MAVNFADHRWGRPADIHSSYAKFMDKDGNFYWKRIDRATREELPAMVWEMPRDKIGEHAPDVEDLL